jgi:hypothetical protein
MKTVSARTLTLVAAVAAALLSACAVGNGSAAPNLDVERISVYELGEDPQDAAAFTGNELIFEARVDAVEAARVVNVNTDGSGLHSAGSAKDSVEYIYTPVKITVTRVHKGDLKDGQALTLRYLGGQVGTKALEMDGVPSIDTYQPGTDLLLFTQEQVDVGDGVQAITPNFAYVIADGLAVGAVDSEFALDVDAFRALVRSKAGS